MTREYLKSLGLSDEQINGIMAQHGQTNQSLQTQLATTQAQLTEAQASVSTLTAENGTLKAQNEENSGFKAKYQTERVNTQLLGSGAKSKYLDVLNARLVDVTDAELPAKIAALKAELVELFDGGEGFKTVDSKLPPAEPGAAMTKEKIMKIENQKERQSLIAKNLDLFK